MVSFLMVSYSLLRLDDDDLKNKRINKVNPKMKPYLFLVIFLRSYLFMGSCSYRRCRLHYRMSFLFLRDELSIRSIYSVDYVIYAFLNIVS